MSLGLVIPETGIDGDVGADVGVAAIMAINDINRFLSANAQANETALNIAKQLAPLDLSYLNSTFNVSYVLNDSSSSPSQGLLAALYQIEEEHAIGLIGDTFSEVCESVEFVAKLFNVPAVSFACTSAELSDRTLYPTFFRTVPSDALQGSALAWLVASYGWESVAVLSTTDVYALGISQEFESAAASLQINILSTVTFPFGSTFNEADAAVIQIKASGARIILIAAVSSDATFAFQSAANHGMFSAEYVWIGPDGVFDIGIFSGNATLGKLARGLLATTPFTGLGLPGYEKFQQLWLNNSLSTYPQLAAYLSPDAFQSAPFEFSPQAYDAVLMYAVAANRIVQRQQNEGVELQLNSELLLDEFQRSDFNFTGVSGFIYFQNGDRMSPYIVYNLNQEGTGYNALGIIQPQGLASAAIISSTVFFDGSHSIPSDIITVKLSLGVIVFVNVLMAIESVWVIFCAAFTIYHRNSAVIRASAPAFLLVMALGILLGLSSIPLLSFNSDSLCVAYPFILGLSVVIIFAALFIKTHRVALIFNQNTFHVLGSQLSTARLLLYVLLAIVVESLFDALWLGINPDKLQHISDSSPNEYYVGCGGGANFNAWLIASYSYKGAALLWGVYLAISVRSVYSYFNESKFVISCIFIVAFTAMIVPAAFYTSDQVTVRFLLQTLWILLLAAYIPTALWLPKIYTILFEPNATGIPTPGSSPSVISNRSPIMSHAAPLRGVRLLSRDHLVAPGVHLKADLKSEVNELLAMLGDGLKRNDLSLVQHAFYKGVIVCGLVHSHHVQAAHHVQRPSSATLPQPVVAPIGKYSLSTASASSDGERLAKAAAGKLQGAAASPTIGKLDKDEEEARWRTTDNTKTELTADAKSIANLLVSSSDEGNVTAAAAATRNAASEQKRVITDSVSLRATVGNINETVDGCASRMAPQAVSYDDSELASSDAEIEPSALVFHSM